MDNFLSTFNKILNRDSNKTYADLMNNNIQEKVKRSLTPLEQEQYDELESVDKQRLFESGGNNKMNDNKITKPKTYNISGIGEVQQIM